MLELFARILGSGVDAYHVVTVFLRDKGTLRVGTIAFKNGPVVAGMFSFDQEFILDVNSWTDGGFRNELVTTRSPFAI